MHKLIMERASRELKKDASNYSKKAKKEKGVNKKHELIEKKEALSASKALSKKAKTAHEY